MASQSRFVYLSNSDSTFILQRREYPTHSRKRPLKKSHEATVSETLCNVKSRYVVPLGDFLSGLRKAWVGMKGATLRIPALRCNSAVFRSWLHRSKSGSKSDARKLAFDRSGLPVV